MHPYIYTNACLYIYTQACTYIYLCTYIHACDTLIYGCKTKCPAGVATTTPSYRPPIDNYSRPGEF